MVDDKVYIVYSKHDCPWCDRAKAVLENLQIPYEEKIFGVDFTKDELIAMLGADMRPTVPQIYVEEERIGGYEDLRKYLKIE